MSQHTAFLNAIRANSDEDTPRLAFADWLAEQGEGDRSEFVRAQIEQTHLSPDDDRQSVLHAKELRLLAKHGVAWTAGPPILRTARFRRGFAEFLGAPAAALAEQLSEVVSLAPIRELWITNMGDADGLGAKLAELSALEGIDAIGISDMNSEMTPAEQLIQLFSSPHLRRIRKLTMFCPACTPEVLDQLLSLPALQHVESLHFNGGLTADDAIGILAKHPKLPIRAFRAHKGPHGTWAMSLAGLYALAHSGHWQRLEELNVGIRSNPEFLTRVAEGLPHSGIHTLWLHNGISETGEGGFFSYQLGSQDYGIEAFAAADSWGKLRDLRFEYIEMNRGQLPALLAAKPLANLTRLSIFGGMLGPDQAAELFRCQALAGLRTLELSGNFALGPGLADHLVSATHLTNLTDLRLIWVQGTDAVAEAVARSPHFAKLRNLELANNYVSVRGMKTLGGSPYLSRVNRLRLFEHPYGPWQRLLHHFDPQIFRMTAEASAALASGLPNLGCLELHGYDFPDDSFAPLLATSERLWITADLRRIDSPTANAEYAQRTQELWVPPLDRYVEEEEPFP